MPSSSPEGEARQSSSVSSYGRLLCAAGRPLRLLCSSAAASISRRSNARPCRPTRISVSRGRSSRLKRFLSIPKKDGASRRRTNLGRIKPSGKEAAVAAPATISRTPRQLNDPLRLRIPRLASDAIKQALIDRCDEPEFSLPGELDHSHFVEQAAEILAGQLYDGFSDEVPDRWFVSCWHAGEALTDLMWRSYGGHKGVCISCDGPALLSQLRNTVWVKRNLSVEDRGPENFEFLYGYVDYERPLFEVERDDESGPTVAVGRAAFSYRRSGRSPLDLLLGIGGNLACELHTGAAHR